MTRDFAGIKKGRLKELKSCADAQTAYFTRFQKAPQSPLKAGKTLEIFKKV